MEEIANMIREGKIDEAKQKILEIKSVEGEEKAGYFYCIMGEIYCISKQKERVSQLDMTKIEKILGIINDNSFSDDFDSGYAKCLKRLAGI
jgi:hypothetical protein